LPGRLDWTSAAKAATAPAPSTIALSVS